MLNTESLEPSVESLWQEALDKLEPEDKASITNKTTDKIALLQELLSLAESKRDACLQKRWKYKRGDSEDEIIIRDQVEKIITWVQRFKEVGSTAIQYDPVHAALPWAGVVLVLQITCNDSQTFGAMIDGIESVTSLIVRCSVIEQLCLSDENTSLSRTQLRQALVKLYISILRYLTKAQRYFGKRTLARMVKSAVSTPEMEVQRYLDIIAKKAQAVHSCFIYVQSEQQIASGAKVKQCLDVLNKLEEPIVRCSSQIAYLYRQLTMAKRSRIATWLSTINVRKHHNFQATDYLQGSCSWLFKHPEFLSWKRSSTSSIVWLHGIPGCGKTKMVYYTISRLLEEAAKHQNAAPVLYFYCARNPAEIKRSDPIEIIRSLLKQLAFSHANGTISEVVAQLFEEKDQVAEQEGCEIEQLTMEECITTILAILENHPATIIIDALDEVDPTKRHKLLLALQKIIQNSSSLVKVMVSSRDDGDLRGHLSNLLNIYIQADNNAQDLRRFINHYVQQALDDRALLSGVISDDLKAELIEHLERNAGGMFRWVTVQVDNLCDNRRIKIELDVREELVRLPETLQALYDQNYDRIRQLARPSRLMAERTIKWLICAQSLMTLDELLSALIFAHENHSPTLSPLVILDTCCNMVMVDNDGFVRFAHLSVREYFEGHEDYKPQDCHAAVLHRCLEAYTNTSLDWRFHTYHDTDIKIRPYATLHWPHHFRLSCKTSKDDTFKTLLEDFLFDEKGPSEIFKDWVGNISNLEKYRGTMEEQTDTLEAFKSIISSPPSPLFLASYCNSIWVLEEMQKRHLGNWSLLNNKQESAAYVAVQMNCLDALYWLLESELIDPEQMVNALHLAIEKKEMAIAKSLIDYGVDGTTMTKQRQTGLGLAAIHGQYEVSQEILRRSQNSTVMNYAISLGTALCCTIQSEYIALFMLLWDALVKTDPPTFFRILLIIAQKSSPDTFQVREGTRHELLSRMFEHARDSKVEALRRMTELPDILGKEFDNIRVVRSGSLATTSFRITKSNSAAVCRLRPFVLVTMGLPEEYTEMTSILLDLGLTHFGLGWERDFDSYDVSRLNKLEVGMPHDTWFLLEPNFWVKSPRLLNQILKRGMDINARTSDQSTVLMMVATLEEPQDCLEILIDNGADMELVDEDGATALHYAVAGSNIQAVSLLLDRGAEPNVSMKDGLTPLDFAANECEHEILRLLRSKGARRPMFSLCEDGITILFSKQAECVTCLEILIQQPLLRHYDDEFCKFVELLPIRDSSPCSTPPNDAGQSIKSDLNDIDINTINLSSVEDGITPLQIACISESTSVAQRLLELGVDVNAVNSQGFSALHYAVSPFRGSIIQLLLSNKADPLLQDPNGRTSLHIAIGGMAHMWRMYLFEYHDIVRLLIGHMTTLDTPDINGDTALHIAIQKDDLEAVKLLLAAGANENAVNKAGQSPLDVAKSVGGEVLELLWDVYDIFSNYHTSLFDADFGGDDSLGGEDVALVPKVVDDHTNDTQDHDDDDDLSRAAEGDKRCWDTEVDYYSSHGVQEFSELSGADYVPLRPLALNHILSEMR